MAPRVQVLARISHKIAQTVHYLNGCLQFLINLETNMARPVRNVLTAHIASIIVDRDDFILSHQHEQDSEYDSQTGCYEQKYQECCSGSLCVYFLLEECFDVFRDT